jgi:hypothetical protein
MVILNLHDPNGQIGDFVLICNERYKINRSLFLRVDYTISRVYLNLGVFKVAPQWSVHQHLFLYVIH